MLHKIIIGQIKKKIEKNVSVKLKNCVFQIYYLQNEFILICEGLKGELFSKNDLVENYTDLSDILIAKIKDKINAKRIDRLDLNLNFEKNSSFADVYFIDNNNNKVKYTINEIL